MNKTLIIGDIHIGYEEALNKQGMLVPREQFKKTLQRLKDLGKADTIIINGDLKHEFGTISETEWRHTLQLIGFLAKQCKHLILLKGNHDTILGPIAKKRNIEVKDYHIINDIYICHGHIIPKDLKKCKRIIIGHEHPALTIREGSRVEKFKCFLKGKYKNKELIVMPSLHTVTDGTDIISEKRLSPFLTNISSFEVYVVDGENIFSFGEVQDLV